MKMVKCRNCGKVYPMNLSNCPDCFTKRKIPAGTVAAMIVCVILVGVLIGILFSGVTSDSNANEVPNDNAVVSGENSQAQPVYIEVSAHDLFAAFEENEIAADKQYKGKLVKVTGIVSDINSEGFLTSANILLDAESSSFLGSVQCNFNSKNQDSLANIEKGQSVTVIGTCGGLSSFNVILSSCKLG